MNEKTVIDYVKGQLGRRKVEVELTKADYLEIINQAILKLKPYYSGVRYVQASGKILDLSNHDPIAVSRVWNARNIAYSEVQDFMFGGVGLMIWDINFMQRFEMMQAYRMLWNELQYEKGANFRLLGKTLYLDGYMENALIEMTVNIKVVSDIEDSSMYSSWFNEYCLALAKERLGRERGKTTLTGSPITLDGDTLLSEAQTEKANLEDQLEGDIYVI
jgi:hypothetical protein